MESKISINTPDDHIINGILNEPNEKTEKLVIIVHGFTGNCNEHIHYNGAKYFKDEGIASFRFNLYSAEEKARSMVDCDIQTHVNDLRTVFDYFKGKYLKIYLVGHSMGGIVVLESKLDVDGIILWDSSHGASSINNSIYKYNESLKSYILNWGIVYVIGKKMFEDKLKYTAPDILMSQVNCPIKIICAGNSEVIEGGKDYYRLAKEPKSFKIIEGACHTFDEEGTEDELLKETAEWVKLY